MTAWDNVAFLELEASDVSSKCRPPVSLGVCLSAVEVDVSGCRRLLAPGTRVSRLSALRAFCVRLGSTQLSHHKEDVFWVNYSRWKSSIPRYRTLQRATSNFLIWEEGAMLQYVLDCLFGVPRLLSSSFASISSLSQLFLFPL